MLTQSLTQVCGGSGGGIFPGYLNSGGHKASSERAGPGGRQLSLLQAWLRRMLFRISLMSYLPPLTLYHLGTYRLQGRAWGHWKVRSGTRKVGEFSRLITDPAEPEGQR